MLGTLRLNDAAITEIERDSAATLQAVFVILICSLATSFHVPGGTYYLVFVFAVWFIFWWLIASWVIYFLGTTVFRTPESGLITFTPLLRGIGFAMTPHVFRVFMFIEVARINEIVFFLTTVWQFAAMHVAVRVALGRRSDTMVMVIVGIALVPLMVVEYFLLRAG